MRTWRAYFNRKREAPQVWSIDEGSQDSEINVIAIVSGPGCHTVTRYDGTPVNDDTPSAWLEISATNLHVEGGLAYFS